MPTIVEVSGTVSPSTTRLVDGSGVPQSDAVRITQGAEGGTHGSVRQSELTLGVPRRLCVE